MVLLFILFGLNGFAYTPAARLPNENWFAAREKNYLRDNQDFDLTPEYLSKDSEKVDLHKILTDKKSPLWTEAQINEVFVLLRDHRFLKMSSSNKFLRRSTWLYPDDGCFARAELLITNGLQFGFPKMDKIFSFGNLTVSTNNSPSGEVNWWYHVVPIVRTVDKVFVLDPALDPTRALLAQEWLDLQGDKLELVKVAVCNGDTYEPFSSCLKEDKSSANQSLIDQLDFLDLEWSRLLELNRNPELELGDFPPWLENKFL